MKIQLDLKKMTEFFRIILTVQGSWTGVAALALSWRFPHLNLALACHMQPEKLPKLYKTLFNC